MAPKKTYSKQQLSDALEAVERGISITVASKTFGIPRTTLLYKSTGKFPVNATMGPATILTAAEEAILVEWILSLANMHYPITKDQLIDSVEHIIRETKRPNPFKENRPGRKWYQAFLKRHPELSERVAQNLTTAREAVNEDRLRGWFQEIEQYLKSKNLFDISNNPSRVFNSDESAFFLQPKGEKVLSRKGNKSVYNAGTNDEKENLTVLVTANAAGNFAPPMIVFKYERIPAHIALSINRSWGIGKSDTGWMCGSTFFEYIANVFTPWLNASGIERPILLFIDGHVSHMTLHLSRYCAENGIELLALYPNSTHLIQPMDVAVFRPLKGFWKKSVRQWHIDNNGLRLRKENFGPVFERALNNVTPETIKNGFRASGLCPFQVGNVTFNKMSSRAVEANIPRGETIATKLRVLQELIPKDVLKMFREKENEEQWSGRVEDTSLFEIWKNLRQHNKEANVQTNIIEEDIFRERAESIHPIATTSKEPEPESQSTDKENHDVQTQSPHKLDIVLRRQPLRSTDNITPQKPEENTFKASIPTPFKKALFWPEQVNSKNKRKKEKLPSAITSEEWQHYHLRKENEKRKKEEEKKQKAELRQMKKEEKENQKQKAPKRKRKESTDSTDDEEWIESGSSLDDVSLDEAVTQEEPMSLSDSDLNRNLSYDDIKVGDFILVNFLGGKRQTAHYKYVCVLQEKNSEHDLEVMSLKSVNDQKTVYKLMEHDLSLVQLEDIEKKLPNPEIQHAGDRLKYVFPNKINVYEA